MRLIFGSWMTITIIFFLFAPQIALSQTSWQQTKGPGGPVYSVAANSSGHLFAATYNQGVFRSTDDGVSWIRINTGLNNL